MENPTAHTLSECAASFPADIYQITAALYLAESTAAVTVPLGADIQELNFREIDSIRLGIVGNNTSSGEKSVRFSV